MMLPRFVRKVPRAHLCVLFIDSPCCISSRDEIALFYFSLFDSTCLSSSRDALSLSFLYLFMVGSFDSNVEGGRFG